MRTPHALIASAPALLLLLLLAPAAAAQDLACGDCHDVEVAEESVHSFFGCADCHTDVAEFPHGDDLMAMDSICGQCHDAGGTVEESVHGGVAACGDCHGQPHEMLAVSHSDSPASVRLQPQTCGQCHDEELIQAFVTSVHGDALLGAGLAVAPSCSGCHGAHDVQPTDSLESQVSFAGVPETCGQCHMFILEDWTRGAHGKRWQELVKSQGEEPEAVAAADGEVPVCSTCHASHRIAHPEVGRARLASVEVCGDCHSGRFHTYRDSFHGQATSLGFELAATCADCHRPHVNLPATAEESSVHPDNLAVTCGQCHDNPNPAFLTFQPHADPADPEESHPVVHWIYVFMTGLLIAVFSFFGLHTVLWLQRALVGWARGELESSHSGDGPWVKRFRRYHRGTHLLIIVSFLLLAATGLPLKFHYTDWAQTLGRMPGFIELAHILHRLCAVITFGYAIGHVGYIYKRVVMGKDGGLMWGWRSMVPRLKDLTDLLGNLRWFLYMGKRPKFDRWTYWEKFDYFAVFWGVPIIGGSGLMLWFPQVFTAILPGWALNAAWVVHSDEALLATGFIFIFHFFHTHLRPEAFPMDPVMFVGSMPLERFKEERPEEYRRLEERGELEAMLVDPPTRRELVRARIFGFTAVVIGLALAAGILVGVFAH